MTRLAILSDIHGNLPALEAVLADMKNLDVDQVIVAGDVINFGPSSNQTAKIVIEQNWPVIRGNNEYFLLDANTPRAPVEWGDPIQFAPTIWTIKNFDPNLKNIIATWPDTINLRFNDAPPIQVFHGTPDTPWDSIHWTMSDEEIGKLLSSVDAEYVICGHTHLPMEVQVNRWHIFNPGSVGLPLDGIFSASYMLVDGDEHGWRSDFRRISFDYDAVFEEFETSGFNKECGPVGKLIVEIYRRARPTFGFFKWRELYKSNPALTVELVDEFFQTRGWQDFISLPYRVNLE